MYAGLKPFENTMPQLQKSCLVIWNLMLFLRGQLIFSSGIPYFDILQCLLRLPHFDARFTIAGCGPDSPIGRMFFAASDQNSQQLDLLFEAFNVHRLILHKLDHRRKNWCFASDLKKPRTPPKPKSIDEKPTQSTQKPLQRMDEETIPG